jgi:spore maturation protein CgeB
VVTPEGLADLKRAAKWKPDVLLFTIHFGLEAEHVREFKKLSPGTLVAMHYADQRNLVAGHVAKFARLLDVLLVNNEDEGDWEKYREAGIRRVATLHEAVSPAEYWPMPAERKSDVFLGGNNFKGIQDDVKAGKLRGCWWADETLQFTGANFRWRLACRLNEAFDLRIRGSVDWDPKVFRVEPMVFHPDYLRELRSAPVAVGTNHLPKFRGYMRRQFRTMAAGTLYACEYVPGMERDFENHVHLIWFHGVEEAVDLIGWYLKHEGARERVAVNGRKLVCERHTFKHRLSELRGLVEGER